MTTLFLLALLAQSPYDPQTWFGPACPTCGVHGWIDYPAPGATIPRGGVLAGWGFECVSGRPVDRVELFYETDDGATFQPLKQDASGLHWASVVRPDVFAAFAASCSAVRVETGWWMTITQPPPPGARRVIVQLWYGPYHADLVRTFNFR